MKALCYLGVFSFCEGLFAPFGGESDFGIVERIEEDVLSLMRLLLGRFLVLSLFHLFTSCFALKPFNIVLRTKKTMPQEMKTFSETVFMTSIEAIEVF